MPSSTLFYEVRQRSPLDVDFSRELGNFTDEAMARQVIDWCYREAYTALMKDTFVPTQWLTSGVKADLILRSYDDWKINDLNSPFPLFFPVQHVMFNAVPTWNNNFIFTQSDQPFDLFTPVPQ